MVRERVAPPAGSVVVGTASEPLHGLKTTSLAVWKRQSTAKMAEASLILPLDASKPESWSVAEAVLRRLQRVKQPPRLYLHFRNALSASSWLSEDPTALSNREVEDWLRGLGWRSAERQALNESSSVERLAPHTMQALNALFRELKPEAAGDFHLWRVEPGSARALRSKPAWADRRLSLVILLDPQDSPFELDRTLFSLSGQTHRPTEWIVSGRPSPEVRKLFARHRALSGASLRWVDRFDQALERASGRYLAFVTAGAVIYPNHYATQIVRLAESDRAWSLCTVRKVDLEPDFAGNLHVATKHQLPGDERLEPMAFARERVALFAAVIDRARLGAFELSLDGPDGGTRLLWRLAALFEPLYVPGLPELELRGGAPASTEGKPHGLAVLRSGESWLQTLELAREQVRGSGVRRQFVDRVNARLKARFPTLHRSLKELAQGWLQPKE